MIDAIEFRSPWHMARILLRRPHSLSTVHAMVANEFGFAPPMADLVAMKTKYDAQQPNQFVYMGAINYSNTSHEDAMERGSVQLAQAIRAAL